MKTALIFESIINHTADAIAVLDRNTCFVLTNPAFEYVYGWTSNELLGNTIPTIPDYLKEETSEIYQKVFKGETINNYITERLRKDNSIITVDLTLSPIKDDEGHVVGIAAITRNVTEYYDLLNELTAINERYELITNNMSDVITLIDFNGKCLYNSPSYEKFTGEKYREEVHPLQFIHPEDRIRVHGALEFALENCSQMNIDYRVIHNNGQVFHVETTGIPFEDEWGKKLVMTTRDITKRKEAESILQNSEKNAVIGKLAAGIAHEIRNPLTSLRGFLQLMKESNEVNHTNLTIMFSEIDRINTIVGDLLLLAKPKDRSFQETNLTQILEEILHLLQPEAMLKKTQFERHLDLDAATIYCDVNQLKQVFINIIKNGIEAMEEGGTLTVSVVKHSRKCVHIKFADQGCGIHPDQLAKLGEPFYTTKENGTGLGLMVSKKIIQDHGGKLRIESELGKGTMITIKLPVYEQR